MTNLLDYDTHGRKSNKHHQTGLAYSGPRVSG
jgi:hypothetical protein